MLLIPQELQVLIKIVIKTYIFKQKINLDTHLDLQKAPGACILTFSPKFSKEISK